MVTTTVPALVIGARLDWYDRVTDDGGEEYRGSASIEDGLLAVALPRAGDAISPIGLIGPEWSQYVQPLARGPFARVAFVEHYTAPLRGEGRTLTDQDWTTPSACVVVRAVVPPERVRAKLCASLIARGWSVTLTDQGENARLHGWT